MEPARPRAGLDRDEGVPAPTSGGIQLSGMRAEGGISGGNQKKFKFF